MVATDSEQGSGRDTESWASIPGFGDEALALARLQGIRDQEIQWSVVRSLKP